MTLDASVVAAMARWPNVPDVYNWLKLDARGRYRVRARDYEHTGRFDTISNVAVVEFIGRWSLLDVFVVAFTVALVSWSLSCRWLPAPASCSLRPWSC